MEKVLITDVDRSDGDTVIVQFSDGTWAQYTVDELLELRSERESVDS